jgi:hypothetical protein
MRWLNSEYVRIFNKRYKRVGHLFQGRYKSILVGGVELPKPTSGFYRK